MRHTPILTLLASTLFILFFSCREHPAPELPEDYEQLFPFTGISKPENSFEDMDRLPCDPNKALSDYKYPGVETSEEVLDYEVTLRCYFTAGEDASAARYVVRYINDQKALVELRSQVQEEGQEVLSPGVTFEKVFRVRSGYPLYLSVSGVAPRGSSIKASISARSTDGLVVVPSLVSEQSQNKEGPNALPNPYCEYIILP